MEIKRYSLLGNYGYICPMIFTEDLTGEIYIEPTYSYEDFENEIKEKLGIEDISNTPVYLPYCEFYYGYRRNGLMYGSYLNPKKAFERLEELKKTNEVKPAKTC